MKKRLLSAFLAVMMVLTMAPVAFAADTSATVSTQDELLTALNDASITEITLTNDIALTGVWTPVEIAQGRTLVINGAGNTISDLKVTGGILAPSGSGVAGDGHSCDYYAAFIGVNKGTLTINNLKFTNADVDIKPVTVSLASTGSSMISVVCANNAGDMVYNDVEVQNCVVRGYTKVGLLNGFTSPAKTGSFVANHCAIVNCEVVVEADGTDPEASLNAAIIGYDGYNHAKTNGIKLQNVTCTIDESVKWADGIQTKEDGTKYCGRWGIYSPTYAHDNYDVKTVPMVAEIDGYQYESLADAIAAAEDGDTVTLLKNTVEDVVIPAGKTITLDLNGKKLTNKTGHTITVEQGATLTINGKGTVDNVTHQKTTIYNKGTVTLNGGTYDRSKEDGIKDSNTYYTLLNHGTMTVANVTVNNNGGYSSLFENGYFNQKPETKNGIANPILTINSGNFTGGINTVKNDDDATMIINDGTFANYAQAAFQNHNIATINGGTFDGSTVYAILNCGVCTGDDAEHDKHQLFINDGKFSGKIRKGNDKDGVHYDFGSIAIKGGYFTVDPTEYLATSTDAEKKYIAKAVTGDYKFHVELADKNDLQVVPVAGATSAPRKEELKNNKDIPSDKVDNIVDAAKAVSAPEISKAAQEVAANISDNSNTLDKQYQDAAKNEVPNQEKIEVRTYLDVEPKAYNESAYTLDITPKYDVVVVGTKDGAAAEKVVASDTLKVTNATNVSIQLPADFVANTDTLYVQHKGHEYDAAVTANNGVYTANFTNPDGFSEFTISKTSQSVAKVGNNKYTTFQDAVNAVENNGTIEIVGGNKDYTATISGSSKTIKVKNSLTGENIKVTVNGESKTIKPSEDATFTYTKPSSSSSGGSSSGKTTYKVTTSAVNNGGVNASPSTAEKGATITLTLSPDKGYKLDKLTVTDGSGKSVSTVKKSDTVYTFTMPASAVTVGVSYAKADETPSKTTFNDVSANDWFASAVDYVTGKGMMNGTAANTFSPKANTTRGMLMTVLARHAGEDTTGGSVWYEKGMNWAKANGVSDGTNPQVNITREQLAAMLYRYAQNKKYDVSGAKSLDGYTDAQSVSSYAVPALQWANAAGVVNGKSGSKLDPKGYATRAEVAAMLMRFCENVEK